ncbi:GRAM domain-containing protein [Psychrobacter sp. I-STPA6b]|uniref:GRAM domain-containing protein n=1 Tax=Psychrobacter sp. I-STPA6b TaxID=2585718 RepID=UPI001D0CDB07|nr:GRAM domain-containing protein [Psychrobacter sp. I-STPA6b]
MENNTKKIDWKQHIILFLRTAIGFMFLLYIINWITYTLFDWNKQSIASIVIQGIMFGLLFGFMMPIIRSKLTKNIQPTLATGEQIEYQTPANLFKGIESVGGVLFITNQGLVFKSHKANIQTGQTNIAFTDIEKIEAVKTAKLVDNGLKVIKKDGLAFQFVVNDRDELMAKINEKL